MSEQDTTEEIRIRAEKRGSKKEIDIIYQIDFANLGNDADEVKITKQLTPHDKRVYIAIAALYNAGNEIMSLTQIHYATGHTTRPNADDLERISLSIKKMRMSEIRISNKQEAAEYNYTEFVYTGSLLPSEQAQIIANGQIADSAIRILREPPAVTFAKQRKQITTIDAKLLQSPISKTDSNLLLDDYLIQRIYRAKASNQPHKILYKTLYEVTGTTDRKQRQRLTGKIECLLTHYQKCGIITRYTLTADGITVYF